MLIEVRDQDSIQVIEVLGTGPQGPRGANGSTDLVMNAGVNVSAFMALKVNFLGKVIPCGNTSINEVNSYIGLATNSASAGQDVIVKTAGLIEDASFTFILNSPIFIGSNGQLTQIFPTTGYIKIIGWPITTNKFILNSQQPIVTL